MVHIYFFVSMYVYVYAQGYVWVYNLEGCIVMCRDIGICQDILEYKRNIIGLGSEIMLDPG